MGSPLSSPWSGSRSGYALTSPLQPLERVDKPEGGLRIEPLAAHNFESWRAMFSACENRCFCRYWHFAGSKNEWLARCADEPMRNAEDQRASLLAGRPDAHGLVAIRANTAVGWLKLVPRSALSKLRTLGAYRLLELGDDAGIWSIACLLVHPSERGRGIAGALVHAAVEHCRAQGGAALEAYPRRAELRLHPEELWMGPEATYVATGFRAVHDAGPYPVFRKSLS